MTEKLWGGRFKKETGRLMGQFSSSLAFDQRLYRADIKAGIAHARALAKGGYLTGRERDRIVLALEKTRKEIEAGEIKFRGNYEDVHSFILGCLIKKAGAVGNKLHTGRSRNDLIVLDTRIYLKEEGEEIEGLLSALQKVLVKQGIAAGTEIIPGYTHLQHAQPVLLAHHLLAYVEMLERDRERLRDALKRVDILPAGSGALAGTSLEIDQNYLAELLGFSRVAENSLDAVSDRDFIAEVLSVLAIVGMHLSRLSEELVLWSTGEFDFIRLDEAYCTGSSFLPQKLNPDPVELIRGKTGRLYGNLLAVLTILKGLPLSYNRDLQEDKEPLFDSIDTVKEALAILAGVVSTMEFRTESLARALEGSCGSAADLAEYLVKKGVAFRDAHDVVGKLVRWSLDRGTAFSEVTLKDLRKFSPKFSDDALKLLSPASSVRAKATASGTAPARVRRNLKRWSKKLGI